MTTSPEVELVVFENVQLSRGGRVVLDNVHLTLRSGERLGLVGANGAGKSTLQMLALGDLRASEGRVWRAPGLTLVSLPDLERSLQRYFKQHQADDTKLQRVTVHDLAQMALVEVHTLETRLRDAERYLSSLASDDPQLEQALEAYTLVRDQFEQAGGYTAEQRLEAHLNRFNLVAQQPVQSLSAGERARLALAMALSQPAEVLILDEPERHLDMAHRHYLADVLKKHSASLLLSSHDRTLLDKVCSHIGYLSDGNITRYRGNYSAFIRQHDSDKVRLLRAAKLRQQEQVKLEQALSKAPNVSARRRAQRRLARFWQDGQPVLEPQHETQYKQHLQLRLGEAEGTRSPTKSRTTALVSGQHLSVGVLKDISFQLEPGATIALVGPNGAGKTTLLNAIVGKLESTHPDTCIRWSPSARLIYYDSHHAGLRPNASIFEQLTHYVSDVRARSLLGLVGLADHAAQQPASLSAGQRARAGLARVMASEANVILLDEPSEYLDIDMVNVLEQAVISSQAAILLVSHDAALVEATSDRIWSLEDGHLRVYPNLSALEAGQAQPNLAEMPAQLQPSPDVVPTNTAADNEEIAEMPLSAATSAPQDPHSQHDQAHKWSVEALLEQELADLDEQLLDPTQLTEREHQRLQKRHMKVISALSESYNQRQPAPQATYSTLEQGIRVSLDRCAENHGQHETSHNKTSHSETNHNKTNYNKTNYNKTNYNKTNYNETSQNSSSASIWCIFSSCGLQGRVYLQGHVAHLSLIAPERQCVLEWAHRCTLWGLARLAFEHLNVRGLQTQSAQPLAGFQDAGASWWVLDRAHFEVLEGYC